MLKLIVLCLPFLILAGCNSGHHGHGEGPAWQMEVTQGEEGIPQVLPVLIDDYLTALPYSPVLIQAEAPVEHHGKIKRAFSLFSTGEQKVRTEVECDVVKHAQPKHEDNAPAGEATLALLGTTVKFRCVL